MAAQCSDDGCACVLWMIDSCLLWLIRSIIPQDRFRFVRNHLRRGVRYDSGFRWMRADDKGEEHDTATTGDEKRRSLRYHCQVQTSQFPIIFRLSATPDALAPGREGSRSNKVPHPRQQFPLQKSCHVPVIPKQVGDQNN